MTSSDRTFHSRRKSQISDEDGQCFLLFFSHVYASEKAFLDGTKEIELSIYSSIKYCNLREACAMPAAGSDFSLKDWGEVKIERPGITRSH